MIANLGQDLSRAVVRDVQDPNHGVTLCALPGGVPRFVTATRAALWNPGEISILDLQSGARTPLLKYAQSDGPVVTVDWSSDGSLFAYGRIASDSHSIGFHLITGGQDRILATIAASSLGVGATRIEFSPGGGYVAMGAPGQVSSGDQASVQVRRLDGALVFSSGGTGQLTWAGESPKLYFQSSTGIETWDPARGVASLPITTWRAPMRSAGGRWLAYTAPLSTDSDELRLIDTRSRAERSLGRVTDAAWATRSLIWFNRVASCPTPSPGAGQAIPCITQAVIYDTTDKSLSASLLGHVFGSWPESSPSWT